MAGCSIKGCSNPVLARSYCKKHYTRWRTYGNPLTITMTERGEPLSFLRRASESATNHCILWPYKSHYTKGYGSVSFEGRLTGAHRVACIMVHGPAPEGMEAAHSCGVRNCVNHRHLRWATPAENAADKIDHGRHNAGSDNPQAKLCESDVRIILSHMGSGVAQSVVAKQFGVSRRTVGLIWSGQAWRHIERTAA